MYASLSFGGSPAAVTRDQLAYIEREALRSLRVWTRALKHLDRIGASGHELYGIIREACDAEHGLRVHAMYARHDAEKRAKDARDYPPREQRSGTATPPADP